MKMKLKSLLLAIGSLMIGGCSSIYMAKVRDEWSETKTCAGWYADDEYPSVYGATKVAICEELCTWWNINSYYVGNLSFFYLYPLGMIGSLCDIPISIVTDTVMLPYDIYMITSKPEEKEN